MKDFNIDELTATDLVELDSLISAYKKYLKKELGYNKSEADLAATDLETPYDTPYIIQEYEGDAEIEGVEYEVRSCHTDFCYCGMFHLANVTPFEFLMLFDQSTMSDQTVGSYQNSVKKFVIL